MSNRNRKQAETFHPGFCLFTSVYFQTLGVLQVATSSYTYSNQVAYYNIPHCLSASCIAEV